MFRWLNRELHNALEFIKRDVGRAHADIARVEAETSRRVANIEKELGQFGASVDERVVEHRGLIAEIHDRLAKLEEKK